MEIYFYMFFSLIYLVLCWVLFIFTHVYTLFCATRYEEKAKNEKKKLHRFTPHLIGQKKIHIIL